MPLRNCHYGSALNLAVNGPTFPVSVSVTAAYSALLQRAHRQVPPPVAGLALIDTGSGLCYIDQNVLQSLGVPPYSFQPTKGATGNALTLTYPASLSFPNTGIPAITFWDFVALPSLFQEHGYIAIIGRNVLSSWVVIYNGPGGSMTVAT